MTFSDLLKRNLILCTIFFLANFNGKNLDHAHGFMQPASFVTKGRKLDQTRVAPNDFTFVHHEQQSRMSMLPIDDHLQTIHSHASILLSDGMSSMAAETGANSALEGLRTFFIVITALLFGFVGLTYVTAAFIVPQAAKQLEADTKRLRPGLWEEYEAKLGEGETMATRPDLLQELGNIMQPIIIQAFEDEANAKASGVIDVPSTADNTGSETGSDTTPKTVTIDRNQWDD